MGNSHQANVDPEKLRILSTELTVFAGKIEEIDGDLRGGLARLAETFRDDEYLRFRELYLRSSQQLGQFVEAIRQFTPGLDRDVEDLIAAQHIKPEI
jgi:uncharacterized protein YukE